jgi:hypothetical protein
MRQHPSQQLAKQKTQKESDSSDRSKKTKKDLELLFEPTVTYVPREYLEGKYAAALASFLLLLLGINERDGKEKKKEQKKKRKKKKKPPWQTNFIRRISDESDQLNIHALPLK